ncbi:MGMT family protein [Granulicoccus sp. GXG6511]|uniref:MGMT family protein n=1 Tax=Granulicoccus sp. GXG6511 TaxID=3381351 RepID=UPI003D7D0DA5
MERVLLAVELVPVGRVVSYGEVAELVGTSARRVGAVLKLHGGAVPWWRVTNAQGELPAPLLAEAKTHWSAEGIGIAASGRGCRRAQHRADLTALGAAYDRVAF